MKKTLVTAALIAVIGFAGIQAASAHGTFSNNGNDSCGNYNTSGRSSSYNEETSKAFEKFRTETAATRKELFVKTSELNALYRQDNPDEKKVAALTGEIYDLQTQMETKAAANGLGDRFEHGPAMMYNGGGRGGMMGW